MNASFFILLLVAGIFRYLAEDARKAFRLRLASLLPRKIMQQHLQALIGDYPQHFGEFRRRVLPFFALHIFLNAISCAVFLFALWYTPPEALSPGTLLFIRWGGVVIVPVALLMDVFLFSRILFSTFSRRLIEDAVDPEAEP